IFFRKKPFILTVDGPPSQDRLLTLVQSSPVYLDIPSNMPQSFFEEVRKKYPEVKIIASYHDHEKTPENLEEIFAELLAFSPDVIKMACMAQSSVDGLRMLSFLQKHADVFP